MFQNLEDRDSLYLIRARMKNINKRKEAKKLRNRENAKLSERRSSEENSIWRRKLGRPLRTYDK